MNAKLNLSINRMMMVLSSLVIVALAVLLFFRLEGERPTLALDLDTPALGAEKPLKVRVSDAKSGLRAFALSIVKEEKEITLFEKVYPAAVFWTGGAVREEDLQIPLNLRKHGIKDGKAVLRLTARDLSWRRWWHGNQTIQNTEILIDTQAPQVDIVSGAHYVTQGGAGLVVYRLLEECPASGVQVGNIFYPGYPGGFADAKVHLAFFAVAPDQDANTPIALVATDLAGNQTSARLPMSRILVKKFKQDAIMLSDQFLNAIMAKFKGQFDLGPNASALEVYLKVNGEMRKANYETIRKVTSQSDPRMHWQGDFIRLPSSAPRAAFADQRSYMYQGKKVDEQTHLGVDLASLEHSPIPAGNAGKVVYADDLGIYGGTVMLDHGFGLFSMYAHMSLIEVKTGQMVGKGEILGKTGMTGLAAGDHLHYSVLINNTFVNPIEWWDSHWIKNNVLDKLPVQKAS